MARIASQVLSTVHRTVFQGKIDMCTHKSALRDFLEAEIREAIMYYKYETVIYKELQELQSDGTMAELKTQLLKFDSLLRSIRSDLYSISSLRIDL